MLEWSYEGQSSAGVETHEGCRNKQEAGGGRTFLIILLFWFLYLVPSTIFKLIKQKHLIQNPNTGKNVAHGKGSEHGAKKKTVPCLGFSQ